MSPTLTITRFIICSLCGHDGSYWFSKGCGTGLKTIKRERQLIGLNQVLLCHGGGGLDYEQFQPIPIQEKRKTNKSEKLPAVCSLCHELRHNDI